MLAIDGIRLGDYNNIILPSINISKTLLVKIAIFFQLNAYFLFPFDHVYRGIQFDGVGCIKVHWVIASKGYATLHVPHAYGSACSMTMKANGMRINGGSDSPVNRLFASIALDQDEFRLYEDIFARFAPEVPVPDLVIYLSAPVSVLRARIAQRGIHYEQHIDDGYLTRLGGVYDDFFHGYRAAPVMFIDAVAVDLVGQPTHFEALLHAIRTGARQLDLPDPTGKDSDPRSGEARLAV